MKLLLLDCQHWKYQLDHPTPVGEEISDDLCEGDAENALVIFIAVESHDNESRLSEIAKDIRKLARKLEVSKVIINPFAHLSSNLGEPKTAVTLLDALTKKLQECEDFTTERSVFGWYKAFEMSVKGHDRSQIFREY